MGAQWKIEHEPVSDDGANRRVHSRHAVLKRVLIYPVEDVVGLAIHNISDHGMMGEAVATLTQLQRVHISFDSHRFIEGQVRWIDRERFGLSFDHLSPPLHGQTDAVIGIEEIHRRERRVNVDLEAVLAVSRPVLGGLVRNISAGGVLIETSHLLMEGMAVLLQFAHGPTLLSRVQWTDGPRAGLKFSELAPPELLGHAHQFISEDEGTKTPAARSAELEPIRALVAKGLQDVAGKNDLHH